MARDKDDDKRRRSRGKSEDGPSDEELDWLADLRGGRDSRAADPFGEPAGRTGKAGTDGPRGRRTVRAEEPPTGGIVRGGGPGPQPATGPAPGQGVRPVRRTPPLPPISPAGPTTTPASPAGPPPPAAPPPPPAAPPPPPATPAPTPAKAPMRGLLRRAPAETPPPPAVAPAPTPPPPVAPPPTPPARSAGPRPMIDWSDLTGELPAASGPAAPPAAPGPPGSPAMPAHPPEPPRRPAEPRPAAARPDPPRPAPLTPPGPASGPTPGLGGASGPGLAGPGTPAEAMVTTGMIRRAELRKHLRIQQQLKTVTLTLVVLLLLAAYPVYLFVQALARDPVFAGLDRLDLPQWAAYEHADRADGSRWCIDNCRFRTRSWLSERGPDETQVAYAQALHGAGWRGYVGPCQQSADESVITCWKKDEYVMVMHVYPPVCEEPPPRDPVPGASASAEPTAEPTATRRACPGAYVTMYISNAIDYRPQL